MNCQRPPAPTREYARYAEPVVLRSITVGRPVDEVYAFWKDFTNFSRFMRHVESIESLGLTGREVYEIHGMPGRLRPGGGSCRLR